MDNNKASQDGQRQESPQSEKRRLDLLALIPGLKWLVNRPWLQFAVILPNLVFFWFFLLAGLFGSPVGNRNIIIIFVWIFWWFLLISLMVPFFSRVWCTVCPFPFFGEWFQRRSLLGVPKGKPGALKKRLRGLNLKWPFRFRNIWIQNIFFLGMCTFSMLLLTRAIVSVGVLGGLIILATLLAMVFPKRTFCLYVCPVSGFQGLYSTTSTVALRPKDRDICNRMKPGLEYSYEEGIAPCRLACPTGVDSSGYISLMQRGEYEKALKVIVERMPFPRVAGRICHHPCEEKCLRREVDEPVSICRLKRFVADNADYAALLPDTPPKRPEKVAVIGSGPCGLTAAYHLAREGYPVTVYESGSVPGGMPRLTIPEYRLPARVVDEEVDFIKSVGVDIVTDTTVGEDVSFEELKKDYNAVLIAAGAPKPRRVNIPGEDLKGVINGIALLKAAKTSTPFNVGPKVVVIGGGNTAVDAARAARRLGADNVTILYRRTREHMPAIEAEVDHAMEEGIEIKELSSPVEILGNEGRVGSLACRRTKLEETDGSGRPRPVPIEGSRYEIEADTVIDAIGQYTDTDFLPDDLTDQDGMLPMQGDTCATITDGVFAAGDVLTGPGMFIDAVGMGYKASVNIQSYLQGESVESVSLYPADTAVEEMPMAILEKNSRQQPGHLEATERAGNFTEVEPTFTSEEAKEETGRCLSCGICGECYRGNENGWGCPWQQATGALERNNYCSLCMECVKTCPHDNVGLFLRPFGADKEIKGMDESWKAFIMLGLALVYSVAFLGPWGTVKDWANISEVGNWGGFLLYASGIWLTTLVVIPGLWGGACWLGGRLSGSNAVSTRKLFRRYSYMLVPLGLLAWIAFSLPLVMINGSYIISIISDPLGWGWNLFGTAEFGWRPLLPEYAPLIQIPLLLVGLGFAIKRGYDIGRELYRDAAQAVRSVIPAAVFCTVVIIVFIRLYAG